MGAYTECVCTHCQAKHMFLTNGCIGISNVWLLFQRRKILDILRKSGREEMAHDVKEFLDAGYWPLPSKICSGVAYPFVTYGCPECERIEKVIPFKLDNGWSPTYVCMHCGRPLIRGELKEAAPEFAQIPRSAMIQEIVLNRDYGHTVRREPLRVSVFTYRSKGRVRSFQVRCPTCGKAPLLHIGDGFAD